MRHQTMLNPELEDHTGGDLGYLNSLFDRLCCFGQEPTPDIRKNIYFRRFGPVVFLGDTLVTITLSQTVFACIYYIVSDWWRLNTLDAKAIVYTRITCFNYGKKISYFMVLSQTGGLYLYLTS